VGFILWTEGEPTNVPWALLYCTTMVVTQYKTNMIVRTTNSPHDIHASYTSYALRSCTITVPCAGMVAL